MASVYLKLWDVCCIWSCFTLIYFQNKRNSGKHNALCWPNWPEEFTLLSLCSIRSLSRRTAMGKTLKSTGITASCCDCFCIRRRFRTFSVWPALSSGHQQTSPCSGKHAPGCFFWQYLRAQFPFLSPRICFHRSKNGTSKRTIEARVDAEGAVRLAESEKRTSVIKK